MGKLMVENSKNNVRLAFEKLFFFDNIFRHSLEKLKCLVAYTNTSLTNNNYDVKRKVSFVTKIKHEQKLAHEDASGLLKPVFFGRGHRIEDFPESIHADFANQNFGGGGLSRGAVQEEIMIRCQPECLLGKLVFDTMSTKTTLEVIGSIPFSTYTGYGRGFKWNSAVKYDQIPRMDARGHALTEIVTFNAIDKEQFKQENIKVTQHKAMCAFQNIKGTDLTVPAVTGLWGAFAFKNDALLTSVIQMCAASLVGRPLIFTSMYF